MKTLSSILCPAVLLALLVGCDTLECGDGTHREGDRCVANAQVSCAEGTEFSNGRCEAVASTVDAGLAPDGDVLMCGEGTRREGNLCVPIDGPSPERDMGMEVDLDMGPEADGMPPEVDGAPPEDDATVVEPDMGMEPPRGCPDELRPGAPPAGCAPQPGTYCVRGTATEFLTGCKLPDDQALFVAVIDPAEAAGGAPFEQYVRGVGAVSADGTFAINAAGDSLQLAIVIDENPQAGAPDRWTRSVSGVSATPPSPGEDFLVSAFATRQETQAVWNEALGQPDGWLEQTGFLVGRVFEPGDSPTGVVPSAGARVRPQRAASPLDCDTSPFCMRFFDDDPTLTGFMPEGHPATTRSGAYLIHLVDVPVSQDVFFIDGREGYDPVPGGASAGSGFHTGFVPSR